MHNPFLHVFDATDYGFPQGEKCTLLFANVGFHVTISRSAFLPHMSTKMEKPSLEWFPQR